MITIDTAAVERMWAEYCHAHPDRHHDSESPPAEYFGDSPEMADELLEAVITGPKRATAALVPPSSPTATRSCRESARTGSPVTARAAHGS